MQTGPKRDFRAEKPRRTCREVFASDGDTWRNKEMPRVRSEPGRDVSWAAGGGVCVSVGLGRGVLGFCGCMKSSV